MTQLFAKNSGYGIDNSGPTGADQFVILPGTSTPDGTNASTRNNFQVAFDGTGPSTTGKGWYQGTGFNTPATGTVGSINYDFDSGNTQDVSLSQLSVTPTLEFMKTVTWQFFMDSIFGSNDKMYGSAHDDKLTGYKGDDIIIGGYGDKNNSGIPVAGFVKAADFGTYATFGYASDGKDTLRGGEGEDTLDGGTDADSLFGGKNNDTLYGGGGKWNDHLDGGKGADSMTGGKGDDTYVVDNAGDTVVENASEGTDLVQSKVTYTLGANVENLTLIGNKSINGTGNGLDNTLTGNKAGNKLEGGAGADHVHGEAGNDTLIGGGGKDHFKGGKGNDKFIVNNASEQTVENKGEGIDTVITGLTHTLQANVENLTLKNGGNNPGAVDGTGNGLKNTIKGSAGDNVLKGLNGNDKLFGFAGKDVLDGGNGKDIMSAGADSVLDRFDFNNHREIGKGKARDIIKQFHHNEDKIDLKGVDSKAGSPAVNDSFSFSATGPKANSVWVVDKGANVLLRGDVNGNKGFDFEIMVQGVGTLDAGDLIL